MCHKNNNSIWKVVLPLAMWCLWELFLHRIGSWSVLKLWSIWYGFLSCLNFRHHSLDIVLCNYVAWLSVSRRCKYFVWWCFSYNLFGNVIFSCLEMSRKIRRIGLHFLYLQTWGESRETAYKPSFDFTYVPANECLCAICSRVYN